ncbi:hypothetical protein D3C73_550790 [compost metagenome]
MLVRIDHRDRALAAGDLDRDDLLGEIARSLGGGGALLAADGEGVLIGAADAVVVGDVLAGFRHGIDAVRRLHRRIDEAPADGGVVDVRRAREGGFGLGHDEGRAAHALDAARQHQVGVACANGARGVAHGLQARGAQAVDGVAADAVRQAGQKGGHARDVAVVLTRLIGRAQDHVVERRRVQPRIARQQRPQRQGRQIVGAHRGQGAAVAADGGADRVADESVGHLRLLSVRPRAGPA